MSGGDEKERNRNRLRGRVIPGWPFSFCELLGGKLCYLGGIIVLMRRLLVKDSEWWGRGECDRDEDRDRMSLTLKIIHWLFWCYIVG